VRTSILQKDDGRASTTDGSPSSTMPLPVAEKPHVSLAGRMLASTPQEANHTAKGATRTSLLVKGNLCFDIGSVLGAQMPHTATKRRPRPPNSAIAASANQAPRTRDKDKIPPTGPTQLRLPPVPTWPKNFHCITYHARYTHARSLMTARQRLTHQRPDRPSRSLATHTTRHLFPRQPSASPLPLRLSAFA
jgi:hypothetical protein